MRDWSTPAHSATRLSSHTSKLPPDGFLQPLLPQLRRRSRFTTFPEILVIHAKRFQLVNWVPTKLDIPINLPPSDTLSLDKHIGKGLQDTEVELPGDKQGKSTLPPMLEAQ